LNCRELRPLLLLLLLLLLLPGAGVSGTLAASMDAAAAAAVSLQLLHFDLRRCPNWCQRFQAAISRSAPGNSRFEKCYIVTKC
jgi:hypothetical protein